MIRRFHRLSIQRKGMIIAITLLAGSGAVLGAVRLGKRSPTVPTIEVKHEEFLDSTQFRGEVKALKSVTISAPAEAGDLQIVKVSAEGTVVKPGDVVVEFDKTKTEQELAQYQSSLKSAEAEIGQARAQARLAEEEDKTAVLKAGYDVESAKLEASKQEIVSKIEGEEANLKVADAEQKLREAQVEATVRDHLANERTFLAYVRTSLALVGFGFVIARLDPHVRLSLAAGIAKEDFHLIGPDVVSQWAAYLPPSIAPAVFRWLSKREAQSNLVKLVRRGAVSEIKPA